MANTGYLKSVLLLSMVLIFVAPGHAAGRVVTQPETREKAVALFHDGDFDAALPLFTRLVYDYPYDYLLKYFLGASLVETGNYDLDAEKNLILASAKEVPAKVFYYLGVLYHARDNWNSAQRYYNRFKNNTGTEEVTALGIDELSDLCYRQVNPFVTGKGRVREIASGQKPREMVPEEQAKETDTLPPPEEKSDMKVAEDERAEARPEYPGNEPVISLEVPDGKIELPVDTIQIRSFAEEDPGAADPEIAVIPESRLTEPVKVPGPDRYIDFRINDKVTYLLLEMFQEPAAREAYLEGRAMERKLDSLLSSTDNLRKRYRLTAHPLLRDSLAQTISREEYLTLQTKAEMEKHFARAAAIEQEWWKDAGFEVYETFYQIRDSVQAAMTLPPQVIAEPEPSIFRPFAETLPENPEVTAAEDETALPEEKDEGIVYKIQLGSFIREIPAKKKAMFDKISKIRIIDTFVNEEGATVYTTGNLANFEDAITLQNQVRQEGIKDAFVIAMKNGKRVSLPNKAP